MDATDKAAREHAAAVTATMQKAKQEWYGYLLPEMPKDLQSAIEKIDEEVDAAIDALESQRQAKRDAVLSVHPDFARDVRLRQACTAAVDARDALPRDLMTDGDGNPVRCALSGIPIWDDEEIIEDTATGEVVIRALVLPPRPVDDDADDLEEAA